MLHVSLASKHDSLFLQSQHCYQMFPLDEKLSTSMVLYEHIGCRWPFDQLFDLTERT